MDITEKKNRKGFLSYDRFDRDRFRDPGKEFSPIYSWMWDDVISEEETDARLDEMRLLGIKRFYILPIPKEFRGRALPSEMYPDYLSNEYMAQCRYAVKRAAELGMQVWLYDEGGWPSGGACGQVLSESDSYAKETVEIKTYRLQSGEVYAPDKSVAAAFVGTQRIGKGYIAETDVQVDEYIRKMSVYQGTSEVSDVTKSESTDAFLRLTHERYKAAFGEEFGSTVKAVFTDEPTGPRPFPYREELSCAFYNSYAVHIEDYFPVLFGRTPVTDSSVDAIINWYDLCSRYFCRNYLEKEKAFTDSNGMAFLGHMDKDDEPDGSLRGGSYNIMRALRMLDVPGVDVIHRQIYPDKEKVERDQRVRTDGKYTVEKANRFFPRFASSAAAQIGSRHALTESFAVYGDGLTFSEMRYVLNFQAIRGINVFNLMALSYGEKKSRRAGILPHFSEKNGCFSDLSAFNSYCERLAYLVSLGRRAADVALYYPIRDSYIRESFPPIAAHFEAVGEELEKLHVDFDVFDDDVIRDASDEDLDKGVIHIGLASYGILVFPFCKYVSPETTARLARFIAGGGTVLAVASDLGALRMDGVSAIKLSELGSYVHSALDFVGDASGFSVAHSEMETGDIYFLMNEKPIRSTCKLRSPGVGTCVITDLAQADIRSVPAEDITFTLDPGEMVCLIRTFFNIGQRPPEKLIEVGEINDWTLRRTEKMIVKENETEITKLSEPAIPVVLGDWRRYVGEDYSGNCVYEACFAWETSRECVIDLGDVKYSCHIEVNGHALDAKVMSPFRWSIPVEFLNAHNRISVRVTNSCANAFYHTDAFDKGNISSYYSIEKEYLADSLAGGLFGKVKLFAVEK